MRQRLGHEQMPRHFQHRGQHRFVERRLAELVVHQVAVDPESRPYAGAGSRNAYRSSVSCEPAHSPMTLPSGSPGPTATAAEVRRYVAGRNAHIPGSHSPPRHRLGRCSTR